MPLRLQREHGLQTHDAEIRDHEKGRQQTGAPLMASNLTNFGNSKLATARCWTCHQQTAPLRGDKYELLDGPPAKQRTVNGIKPDR